MQLLMTVDPGRAAIRKHASTYMIVTFHVGTFAPLLDRSFFGFVRWARDDVRVLAREGFVAFPFFCLLYG